MCLFGAACLAAPSIAEAKPIGCVAFMDAYSKATSAYGVQFARALNVGGASGRFDYWDAGGEGDVDATAVCRGDQLIRFETRAAQGGGARIEGRFDRYQQAALQVLLGYDSKKSASTVSALTKDALEFLRGSRERGDAFVSGKVERHAGGGAEIGVVYTDTDRTMIVVPGR